MTVLDPVGRFLRLPPPVARRVGVTRRIPVRMRDGVILRADHYAPDLPDVPTVLVRTPYGRGGVSGWLCRAVALRGFHVLVQSCRGTADSGGTFDPMVDERADGLDTVDWLARQPWYDGRLCTYGPSYVGFVQWALADGVGDQLKAMSTSVTASSFGDSTYAGGAFSLDSVLTWSALLSAQRGPWLPNAVELLRGQPRLQRGLAHLPLAEADRVATGAEVEFFQRWLVENDPSAVYWSDRGHRQRLAGVTAPVLMIGGWYDIFLPWQLDDYAALRAAGARPHLTIGPWHHGSLGLFQHSAAESIEWFRANTAPGGEPRLRGAGWADLASANPAPAGVRDLPVRVHVGGAEEWREYPEWPPPGFTPRRWHLQPGAGLANEEPPDGDGALAEFTYDPTHPTPALGGPRLVGKLAGRRDNRPLEARADVRTFTTAPLTESVEAIGPVTASIRVRASGKHFDVFARLCDVDPEGRSWNVCDGLTRVSTMDDGEVRVPLWPTAYRFRRGHRIRLQLSGGAHPRFARNPGTGAGLGEPTELTPVHLEILPPSWLDLNSPLPVDQGELDPV